MSDAIKALAEALAALEGNLHLFRYGTDDPECAPYLSDAEQMTEFLEERGFQIVALEQG